MVMRAELIKQRPDIVKGWLQAELDAQDFLTNPKNAGEVIKLVMTQTTGFPQRSLWMAMYATYPKVQGGTDPRIEFPFTFTDEVRSLVEKGTTFLHSIQGINVAQLRSEAITGEFADTVLKERSLKSPIGSVPALPDSAYDGK
jgi:NitT/TauT family transport system substrate-binding protein